MLIIWDERKGWHQNYPLTGDEAQHKLDYLDIQKALIGNPLDLIAIDNNYMGMVESLYQLSRSSYYLVASESTVPAAGFNYGFLSELSQKLFTNALNAGKMIIDAYKDKYLNINQGKSGEEKQHIALSLLDRGKIKYLTLLMNNLIDAILADPKKIELARKARSLFTSYDDDMTAIVDLASWLNELEKAVIKRVYFIPKLNQQETL